MNNVIERLQIPSPSDKCVPLKNNLYNCMQKGNANLTLLFPYLHKGAIVAAGALFIGGRDSDYGNFYHHNSVDEVITNFSSNGALLQSGQVYCGGRVHGVSSFLKDEKNADSFALMSVIQRQEEKDKQTEAVSIHCSKCRERLLHSEFDATPTKNSTELDLPFPSVACLPEIFEKYNLSKKERTCPKCKTVNKKFPVKAWGWEEYRRKAEILAKTS